MTIESGSNRESYAGNGVTTLFPTPIFLDEADLVVILTEDATGTEDLQVLNTDYTVTGGDGEAGEVTMIVAPPAGYSLVIYVDPAIAQSLDLTETGKTPAEASERAYDKLTLISRRLKDLLERSVRLPDGFTDDFDLTLPGILTASYFLKINATGDGLDIEAAQVGVLPNGTELVGTANQINVANGTGALGNPTMSIADDVVLPGTGGMTVPDGTTAQRPAAVAGKLRYNTTLGVFEVSDGTNWYKLGPEVRKGTINIGFTVVTTNYTGDTLRWRGANGSDLGTTNPGFVIMDSRANPGQLVVFVVTANISLNVVGTTSGAHFALDGIGDLTSYLFHIYAACESVAGVDSLRAIFHAVPGLTKLLNANDQTAPENVTTLNTFLTSTGFAGDANAMEVGWVKGSFDDTGGNEENQITLLATAGNISIGAWAGGPVRKLWKPTGAWSSNTTYHGTWWKIGNQFYAHVKVSVSGAPTSASLTITVAGLTIDTALWPDTSSNDGNHGETHLLDAGVAHIANAQYVVNAGVSTAVLMWSGTGPVTQAAPFTWASGDSLWTKFNVPIADWAA